MRNSQILPSIRCNLETKAIPQSRNKVFEIPLRAHLLPRLSTLELQTYLNEGKLPRPPTQTQKDHHLRPGQSQAQHFSERIELQRRSFPVYNLRGNITQSTTKPLDWLVSSSDQINQTHSLAPTSPSYISIPIVNSSVHD